MGIKSAFAKLKGKGTIMPFIVIGDPDYKTSMKIAKAACRYSGAIELGIPFSDPIADGPVIQAADLRALNRGINTDTAFKFIKELRKTINIPIGLLVYYNLVFKRGIEKFYKDAKKAGVDSILIADLSLEESKNAASSARKNKIGSVFMISPLTTEERMRKILKKTSGFVYVVSRLGITGARNDLQNSTITLIKKIKKKTKLPLCVGFGISRPEHVSAVIKAGADCAIVGSSIVGLIGKNLKNRESMLRKIEGYLKEMEKAAKLELK